MKREIMQKGKKSQNRHLDVLFYTYNSGVSMWIDMLRHFIIVQQSFVSHQKAGQHIAR